MQAHTYFAALSPAWELQNLDDRKHLLESLKYTVVQGKSGFREQGYGRILSQRQINSSYLIIANIQFAYWLDTCINWHKQVCIYNN